MRSGGIVISSDIPVHREIFGDASLYFDAYSSEDAAQVIGKLFLENRQALRARLVEQGAQTVKRYTPETILPQWDAFFREMKQPVNPCPRCTTQPRRRGIMTIIISCGHPNSGFGVAHDVLVACGLGAAEPSRREGITVAWLHEQFLKSHGVLPWDAGAVSQITPGRLWQDMAVDLLLGNLDSEKWGWADSRSSWLLEFWKDFDPRIRFVLVYRPLEQVITTLVRRGAVSAEELKLAARSWIATNRELLRFHHRNRERSLLINGDRLLQSPEQFIAQVGEDFQVPLAPPEDGLVLESAAPSALAALLVKGLPWEDPEAASLYAELEATADLGADQQDPGAANGRSGRRRVSCAADGTPTGIGDCEF